MAELKLVLKQFHHPRTFDWERRLTAYLTEPRRHIFEWGENDCALLACGAVEAMTGCHPAPQFVGAYSDRDGAAWALREMGAGTLKATFDKVFERKRPGFAHKGDLILAHEAIGVCLGADAVFLQLDAPEGQPLEFARVKRADFEIAWKV
jgi:hypothetical protein